MGNGDCMMPLQTKNNYRRWCLDDIAFDAVDLTLIRNDEFLFLTLASASFVEILAEIYSNNLIKHFRGNTEVTDWLRDFWQQEEMQHGRALKAYVQAVWPEFDWESAHCAFRTQYGLLCTVEQLESNRALELVGRCVVETGTSTFYRALCNYIKEPVLRELVDHIKGDEAAHYAHFLRYFAAYNARERHGVMAVIAAILRRLREIRQDDAYIAFKHVFAARHPGQPFLESDWRRYNRTVKRLARRHYPYSMAARMLIKPIPMSSKLKRIVHRPLVILAQLVSLG
jgi:rubrerythrin